MQALIASGHANATHLQLGVHKILQLAENLDAASKERLLGMVAGLTQGAPSAVQALASETRTETIPNQGSRALIFSARFGKISK